MRHEGKLELALSVHSRLSELIAPASPESIRASSWRNWALVAIMLLGGSSFVFFIFPTLGLVAPGAPNELLQVLGAAGLGSTFYALHTATRYLRDRTFDPRYNQVYFVRFALGVFAGFILGTFATELFDDGAERIGATTFALVGGYSSEAVAQVLQRVADTLVTMVRGSDGERAQSEADARAAKKSAKVASELLEALSDPTALQDRVKTVSRELLRGQRGDR